MKKFIGFFIVALMLSGWVFYGNSNEKAKPVLTENTSDPSKKSEIHTNQVWIEEFDYDGLPNDEYWSYDVGDACEKPCGCGWGNNELQKYADKNPKNVRVEDGKLVIELHKEKDGSFTSGRIHTKDKLHWKEGTIEVRAKLAKGLGTWSAIWMMPAENHYGGWPKSGEIDIAEQVGYAPDSLWSAVHVEAYNGMHGTHKNGVINIDNISDDFHTYKLVWTEHDYKTFVDEQHVFTYVNEEKGAKYWPFDQEFYLILNLAYGGNWGGKMGIDSDLLPAQMQVDYIKVYQ